MKITYEIVGVEQAAARIEGSYFRMYAATAREMGVQMLELRNYAVNSTMHGQVVNQRTGKLAGSVIFETEEQPDAVLGRVGVPGRAKNVVPYARILHDGGTTRAHVIEAKEGKMLAFMAGGQMIFRRRVNHPGSKFPPRPYLASALNDMKLAIRAGLAAAMEKAL